MRGYIIRPMTEADLSEIIQIEQESYSDPWSRRMFADHLSSPSRLNLVLSKEMIIGFACTTFIQQYLLTIDNFTIRKEFRGKGIGSLFLGDVLKKGRKLGIKTFTLEVRESNQTAIRLYNKFGFSTCGRRKRYYQAPVEDALIMTREE